MDDSNELRQVVRVYSFQAEDRLAQSNNAHVLARVLSGEEDSLGNILEPWRMFFEPWESVDDESNPLVAVLHTEAERLRKKWVLFQKSGPAEERIDATSSEPTIEGVMRLMSDVKVSWDDKQQKGRRAKAMRYFHRVCGTLDAHSNLMEIVPRGNQYTSLFIGTMSSVIKASVNHEKIAEQFSEALCLISEHIAECEVELTLFKTEAMTKAVADLYAHIFLFLGDMMDWFIKKRRSRLLDSFKENFIEEFENEIENINRKADIIRRKVAQNVAAEQRVTRLTIEETRKDIRLGLEGLHRQQAETLYQTEHLREQMHRFKEEKQDERKREIRLVEHMLKLLTEAAQGYRVQDSTLMPARELLSYATTQALGMTKHESTHELREIILQRSACLENYFDRDRIRSHVNDAASVKLNPEILSVIAEFTMLDSAGVLLVSGPHFEGYEIENPMTQLAAEFARFVTSSKLPLMSYFCMLRRGKQVVDGLSKELSAAIELLYALIRQMIELLPPGVDCARDLSNERFSNLDGTPATWNSALDLFVDIRELIVGRVFCVIEGFQWLDDRSSNSYLTRLVNLLHSDRLKVLFVTSGHSRCLLGCLKDEQVRVFDGFSASQNSLWALEEATLAL